MSMTRPRLDSTAWLIAAGGACIGILGGIRDGIREGIVMAILAWFILTVLRLSRRQMKQEQATQKS